MRQITSASQPVCCFITESPQHCVSSTEAHSPCGRRFNSLATNWDIKLVVNNGAYSRSITMPRLFLKANVSGAARPRALHERLARGKREGRLASKLPIYSGGHAARGVQRVRHGG